MSSLGHRLRRAAGGSVFPVINGTADFAGPNVLTHDVTLPSGIVAGELLLTAISGTGTPDLDGTPSGWSVLFNNASGGTGSDRRLIVLRKTAAGSDTLTVTMTSTASSAAIAAVSFRISKTGAVPEASSSASGSSANPNPGSLTPSWGEKKTLWLAFFAGRAGSVSAIPSNYSDSFSSLSGSNILVGSARRFLRASTEDPGTFTQSASDNWVAATVAVRGT